MRIQRSKIYGTAALASLLILTGCATSTDLLPVEAGDGLLPVVPGNPDDDLLPVEVAPITGKECLPGTWLLDNDTWRALIAAEASSQGVTVRTPTGSVVLTLAESGSYTTSYKRWEIRMETTDGSVVMKRHGDDSGRFSADTKSVTLTETTSNSILVGSIETTAGSIPLPPTSGAQASFIDQFAYNCSGDVLISTGPEGPVTMSRVP